MIEEKDGHHSRVKFTSDQLYIALENTNMDWMKKQVEEFIRLCDEEYNIDQIARFFKRSELECFLLYLDLLDKKKIKPRLRLVAI